MLPLATSLGLFKQEITIYEAKKIYQAEHAAVVVYTHTRDSGHLDNKKIKMAAQFHPWNLFCC